MLCHIAKHDVLIYVGGKLNFLIDEQNEYPYSKHAQLKCQTILKNRGVKKPTNKMASWLK